MLDNALLQKRLKEYSPEPLVPRAAPDFAPVEIPMVFEDDNNIDLAKVNFLNVLNNDVIKHTSEEIIRKYGVGTCGPRAFYGTTDVHLELEKHLAEFLGMEQSIVYSYGFVAISSSIAAYCKRNDVVFVDEKTNIAILQGLVAARSKIVKFSHNDPISLREELVKLAQSEKKKTRKFIIIEGISWETGKLCPLEEFLQVAEEFKIRIFLEESYTFGVFGKQGKGLTEHFNIDPSRLDMIFGTLEGAIGSIGGFCAGSKLTIEHQTLSGAGYIFSASLPTYLVKAALKSLDLIGDKPTKLIDLAQSFHNILRDKCGYKVQSHPCSPFKLFNTDSRDKDIKVYEFCKANGLHFILKENGLMLNLNVNLLDNAQKLSHIYNVLEKAVKSV